MSSHGESDSEQPEIKSIIDADSLPDELAQLYQQTVPKHVAIIMDGNGRWAQAKGKPRVFGHRAGVRTVRKVVRAALEFGISSLTLFAFSSENWRRPATEVKLLMELFFSVLRREVKLLDKNGVRLNIIGDTSQFSARLQQQIKQAQEKTAGNDQLILNIAANYGGRWDITQSARHLAEQVEQGLITSAEVTEKNLSQHLSMPEQGEVDLMIRTGGDCRISNFILWQAAYAELVFTDSLWPDFDESTFEQALRIFASRQRRFGLTGCQIDALTTL